MPTGQRSETSGGTADLGGGIVVKWKVAPLSSDEDSSGATSCRDGLRHDPLMAAGRRFETGVTVVWRFDSSIGPLPTRLGLRRKTPASQVMKARSTLRSQVDSGTPSPGAAKPAFPFAARLP